ncbi:Zn(2)-C6 fungal-type domain-containing protein [Fusarium falciforme]|uniref:Zn(2)-C6 fungal-type domain-containing protein n=1 Tax=Fusarium falciforme TaxID=195108 RepID=UPI002300F196|nr:Zn(2)-C6 fungal-type domain-containing protein [Fusarium falciforme]WAO94654.1 Zn(2)-C6 fungal-type domain-containing protein [Fusarium falciforme]
MASTGKERSGPMNHRRSNGGCITCRVRRVKCDEKKPSCKRCISTGRKCDGYPVPKPRLEAVSVVVMGSGSCSTPGACPARSRQSFQMFSELYAPMLSGYGTEGFWGMVVLQASHVDESIKHLVIAASNLSSSNNVPFLAHYSRALQILSRSQNVDVIIILIACVLLTVCDELQNRGDSAQRHILAGERILAEQDGLSLGPWRDSFVLKEIMSTFSRLCSPRPMISRVPYPST